jgi:Tol biopolymer transport system component/DNA-binding winged helix-turn-helix (wHTH) protein
MTHDATRACSFTFGVFTVDAARNIVRHGGETVPLTARAFQVLRVLLEARGRTVGKDELLKAVWPDLFVEENNLARQVSTLRKVFHQFDPETEYLMTVPGRGYRLAVAITDDTHVVSPIAGHAMATHASGGDLTAIALARETDSLAERRSWRWKRSLALTAAIPTLAFVWLSHSSRPVAATVDSPSATQLTSAGGVDLAPSWSPDGTTMAFASNRAGNLDVWLQRIGETSATQLTTDPEQDSEPTWSPDGRFIAFRSERGAGGIYTIAATGGVARLVAPGGRRPEWSPDGSSLLYESSGRGGQVEFLTVSVQGGEPVRVLPDVTPHIRQGYAGWRPDGHVSIYGLHDTAGWNFWTAAKSAQSSTMVEIASDVRQRLAEAQLTLSEFAWSPDRAHLYFRGTSNKGDALWRIDVDPHTSRWVSGPARLVAVDGLNGGLTVSPDGHRLAFGRRSAQTRVWSLPFDPVTSKLTGRGHPLTPFGTDASIVDVSPDGSRFAYRTVRPGGEELWVRDLSAGHDELMATEERGKIIQPKWSTDGTRLAYLRNADAESAVVLVRASATANQVLPQTHGTTQFYDWMPHGESLIVGCRNEQRRIALCIMPVSSGQQSTPTVQYLARDPGRNLYAARVSPNRRWISFLAFTPAAKSTVYVMPAEGGPWTAITEGIDTGDKPRWSPDGRSVYFLANQSDRWNLWARHFDPLSGRPTGVAFQVTHFDTPDYSLSFDHSIQLSITRSSIVLPITESSGHIWTVDLK